MLTYRREKRMDTSCTKYHLKVILTQGSFSEMKTRWALELDNLKGKTLYFLNNKERPGRMTWPFLTICT
jgi:hypothetical protein